MDRIELLGVQIDNVTYDEVLQRIEEMIAARTPQQIVSPAIDQIIQTRRDPEFNAVVSEAALVVADGVSVTLAAWMHKTPLKQRVTGSDLVPKVCERSAQKGYSIFFLGGDEGVADEVARIMQDRFPGLKIAGTYCPPYRFENSPEEEANVIERIQQSNADILFTALASPRQEKWIRRRKNQYNVPVSFGVGGTFNFITGREKRAPVWMQKLGFEWVYRMMQRPTTVGKRVFGGAPVYFLLMFDRLSYSHQKTAARWLRTITLAVGDILLAMILYIFSYWIYFRILFQDLDPFPEMPILHSNAYGDLFYFLPLLSLPALYYSKLYRRNPYITSYRLSMQSLKAAVFTVFFIMGFQFMFKNLFTDIAGFSRGVFALFGLLYGLGILGWRCMFRLIERRLHKKGISVDRVILVGDGPLSQQLAESIEQHPEWGIYIAGYVSSPSETTEQARLEHIPYLGTIHDLERLLPARKIDDVLITDSNLPVEQLQSIHKICKTYRINASIIPPVYSLLDERSNVKQCGDFRVISL